jgi:predicted TIM-barrel fold metal-dependent hydrolase
VLWRFDMDYRGLRREAPWLRRAPSEYFYEHVRVTTQPLEVAPSHRHMLELLELIGAEDVLCFSSDYPHWDADEIRNISRSIPEAWHSKVFRDNAMELFGWNSG